MSLWSFDVAISTAFSYSYFRFKISLFDRIIYTFFYIVLYFWINSPTVCIIFWLSAKRVISRKDVITSTENILSVAEGDESYLLPTQNIWSWLAVLERKPEAGSSAIHSATFTITASLFMAWDLSFIPKFKDVLQRDNLWFVCSTCRKA